MAEFCFRRFAIPGNMLGGSFCLPAALRRARRPAAMRRGSGCDPDKLLTTGTFRGKKTAPDAGSAGQIENAPVLRGVSPPDGNRSTLREAGSRQHAAGRNDE
jgi:hypothetical protein